MIEKLDRRVPSGRTAAEPWNPSSLWSRGSSQEKFLTLVEILQSNLTSKPRMDSAILDTLACIKGSS